MNPQKVKNKYCRPNLIFLIHLITHMNFKIMVKKQEYREFDRSLTPKMGDNNDHLEQVRSLILKNGFQEPIIIISCDLKTGNAYITEGNHRL